MTDAYLIPVQMQSINVVTFWIIKATSLKDCAALAEICAV